MSNSLPKVVYSPEPELRHPVRLLGSMLYDLLASHELSWRLFVRNLSAQYRQSFLGYLWAFLPPIATTLTFVFLNNQKIMELSANDGGIPYPVYVMVGTLLWQAFVDALNSPLKILNQSRSMLARINFPREALIIAGMGEVLFNVIIRLILLVIVYLWFGLSLPAMAWLAPLGMLSLLGLGLLFGLLMAPVGILYQDIERSITLFISLWFFLTPVIYATPTSWPASLVARLNPVSPLLVTTREMLTTGSLTQLPGFLIVSGVTVAVMSFGWLFYRLAMPRLIERIGS